MQIAPKHDVESCPLTVLLLRPHPIVMRGVECDPILQSAADMMLAANDSTDTLTDV